MKHRILDFPKITDERGNLTFIEQNRHIPFEIKRVYYLYDVPAGEIRGGHAHKQLEQVLIAVSGSFNVIIDDGISSPLTVSLNLPYKGLYLPSMMWREMENFSSGSVCLVLASDVYREEDYIREYRIFKKLTANLLNCSL